MMVFCLAAQPRDVLEIRFNVRNARASTHQLIYEKNIRTHTYTNAHSEKETETADGMLMVRRMSLVQ